MPRRRALSSRLPGLTLSERVRFRRQIALPEVGVAGQRRLKGASALVVGLGGLGLPAATYLAAAGVGRLGLADGDRVETTNLHRQVLFSEADVGRRKAAVAAARLRKVSPGTKVVPMPFRLDSSNALRVMKGYDIVLDCTDNLPSRYLISDACTILKKPEVYASAQRFDGQATVFGLAGGPCYRCLFPVPPPPGSVLTCEESGVMGVVPAVLGLVQAAQALSITLGKGSPLSGRLLVFSALDSSFEEVRVKKDPRCPSCGKASRLTRLTDYEEFCGTELRPGAAPGITPLELRDSLTRGERPLLLDVREPYEYEICHLQGARLVPMGELRSRAPELDKARRTVVYCHVGVRSARAVEILRLLGFRDAVSLEGGIDAWRELVDPSLRAY